MTLPVPLPLTTGGFGVLGVLVQLIVAVGSDEFAVIFTFSMLQYTAETGTICKAGAGLMVTTTVLTSEQLPADAVIVYVNESGLPVTLR